ncbi:uncharacterized protein LOC131950587 [Physella acuta]|uniref:uncharacterized protein LOC131950587 n=1 Tax=Physella acuta TaxID=109671 RepID=UPI0027DD3B85|nr:uncharacterized protein LOC131950587 [Physella acuta]
MGNTGGKNKMYGTGSQVRTKLGKAEVKGNFQPGHHETEYCYGGEADLHKHYTSCKKNPGHVNFIPVNDFNLSHLPSRYHDVIMLEVIKALSALTVLIKVKYTSLGRPKSVPCFSGQYPFYNTRGSDVLRTGTGTVYEVRKHTEDGEKRTCRCSKCRHSDTPSKVWGKITVLTATQVVFDASEARKTRCVVGFDDNKSPGVSLKGWRMACADIERDDCTLKCVSCDMELVDNLYNMCELFKALRGQVRDKYWRYLDVDKLTVIVSHPHGCPKQVSIGRWTQKHKGKTLSKYTYTTCTCPGSSGAHVYIAAYGTWWCPKYSHCGSNSQGNYSGEGVL